MFATAVTMGLAEWIIDDTCLVFPLFFQQQKSQVIVCLCNNVCLVDGA